ncbi:lipopolysaccharide biosynthesis protein [Aquimarina agarivorans]|uniref:lipopolysaccharide biosynthesis protein n=1 Tax=Aquimarina agarivorans TaxID=980584 RepID=UPI000248EB2B|nr:oligosaccharide flippase family protein [Aquimarina agarivorans]
MDVKSKSLLKNTLIYSLGNFGSKILSFGLLPIYSYYLTKKEFGYYDLVVTTIMLVVPIMTMQLSDSVFRWLLDNKEDVKEKENAITNAFFYIISNIIIAILVLFFISLFVKILFFYWIVIQLFFATLLIFIQQTARGLSKNKLYAASGVILTLFLLISNIMLLIVFKMKTEALFISTILSNLIAVFFLGYKINFFSYLKFDKLNLKYLKNMLKYSMPLVPNTLSWWLIMSANKYIIVIYLGQEALGVFGFANRFPVLLVMINSIFMLAWQESAITTFNDHDRDSFFSKIFNKLMRIQFSLLVILILSSELLVRYLVSEDFYESWNYLPFLYVGASFSSLSGFYGSIYIGAKDTKSTLKTSFLAGVSSVLLSYFLVDYIGLYGVCLANTLGFVILFLARVYDTQKHVKLSVNKLNGVLYVLFTIISLFIVYMNKIEFTITSIMIAVLVVLSLNRKDIFILLKQIKK